jgi:regulator of replication initiation timing
MSDIDRKKMIPLHVADQAVAAADAEIQKLWEENARLKAEVERLTLLQAETLSERNKAEAEVERLTKAIMDSVEMRQRLREIENGNQSK